jgi:putative DNA primase/helicase
MFDANDITSLTEFTSSDTNGATPTPPPTPSPIAAPQHNSPHPARRLTDVGNGQRFADHHGGDVRYCGDWEVWLFWDGHRWSIDNTGELMRKAKWTAKSIYVEASQANDKHDAQDLGRWGVKSESRERLNAMLALAASEQPIPLNAECLDSMPWLLNFENGTLDLRTGELRGARREDFLTTLCPLEYPDDAGDEPVLWLEFLGRIFAGDAELIRFVQQLVGMSLVGEITESILPIFYGVGANGKSVFVETINNMLGGDYAMTASEEFLIADNGHRHPTEIADLRGKRFVSICETPDSGRLTESKVKRLTSRESLRARRMMENFWEFKPSHHIIVCTNHKPAVRGTDHGIWRRLRLVPFSVVIPDIEQDKDLPNKLRNEWPAILRWAVGGCLDWQHNGKRLAVSEAVSGATNEYRVECDVLGQWLEECCLVGENHGCQAMDLWNSYKNWVEKRGEKSETQSVFGTKLVDRNFSKKRSSTTGRKMYEGISLRLVATETGGEHGGW